MIRLQKKFIQVFRLLSGILVFLCFIAVENIYAESSFGLKVLPGYHIPLNDQFFKPGVTSKVGLDYKFTENVGALTEFEFISISLENIDPLSLMNGSVGVELILPINDRLSVQSDFLLGLYSVSSGDSSITGISTGARLSGNFQVTPSITSLLYGSYQNYIYTPESFMSSLSVGAGFSIDLTEFLNPKKNIKIDVESQYPVFPVFYSWYDDNPIGSIAVTNKEKNTITDVNVSFFLEKYMGQPKICTTIDRIKPGESVSIPLTAFFNESMLELNQNVETEARIIVDYKRLGQKRKSVIPIKQQVFHRNAMSWDDDRRAAAFVSSKDPAALWFSKYVSSIVSGQLRGNINRNTQYAIGLFEALNVYGINYVVDPSSSYAELIENTSSIDFLQYPYQTLMYRGGDCDDLSILFCSLLEAVGIETAFITIPGHIYMAFDSGLAVKNDLETLDDGRNYIFYNGKFWIPLEITLIKEGFSKAWKIGAKEWRDADSRGDAKIYPMKDSWLVYKPVSIPGAVSRFNLPDEDQTESAFVASLNQYIESAIRPVIEENEKLLAESDSSETRNRVGVSYGKYGILDKARKEFSVAAESDYIHAWINLGNILFMENRFEDALKYYNYALTLDEDNSLALLGASRCYYELDNFNRSDVLYTALRQTDGEIAAQYPYLGSFFETKGRAWSLSDRLLTTIWSLPEDRSESPVSLHPAESKIEHEQGKIVVSVTSSALTEDDFQILEPQPVKKPDEYEEEIQISEAEQSKESEKAEVLVDASLKDDIEVDEPEGLSSMLTFLTPSNNVDKGQFFSTESHRPELNEVEFEDVEDDDSEIKDKLNELFLQTTETETENVEITDKPEVEVPIVEELVVVETKTEEPDPVIEENLEITENAEVEEPFTEEVVPIETKTEEPEPVVEENIEITDDPEVEEPFVEEVLAIETETEEPVSVAEEIIEITDEPEVKEVYVEEVVAVESETEESEPVVEEKIEIINEPEEKEPFVGEVVVVETRTEESESEVEETFVEEVVAVEIKTKESSEQPEPAVDRKKSVNNNHLKIKLIVASITALIAGIGGFISLRIRRKRIKK